MKNQYSDPVLFYKPQGESPPHVFEPNHTASCHRNANHTASWYAQVIQLW